MDQSLSYALIALMWSAAGMAGAFTASVLYDLIQNIKQKRAYRAEKVKQAIWPEGQTGNKQQP